MKNKSLFFQIVTLIIVAVVCLLLTLFIAIMAGSLNAEIFSFENLNFSNIIPVLIIGVFITCVIVGICVLFVARTAFVKAKDYIKENNKKDGGNK